MNRHWRLHNAYGHPRCLACGGVTIYKKYGWGLGKWWEISVTTLLHAP